MVPEKFIIDFDEGSLPYNAYLDLPLSLLQQLMPLLMDEIMTGLVDTSGKERIVLHLLLTRAKMDEVKDLVRVNSDSSLLAFR